MIEMISVVFLEILFELEYFPHVQDVVYRLIPFSFNSMWNVHRTYVRYVQSKSNLFF